MTAVQFFLLRLAVGGISTFVIWNLFLPDDPTAALVSGTGAAAVANLLEGLVLTQA
jgi:hypothetical protein